MTNKSIPEVGEIFDGYVPAKKEVLKVTAGFSTGNDVVLDATGAYTLVDVTRPIVVFGLWTQVTTAFSAGALTIGDSGSADRFIADTTMAPASSGAVLVAATGLSVPYYNSTPDDILMTLSSSSITDGAVEVYIEYAIIED